MAVALSVCAWVKQPCLPQRGTVLFFSFFCGAREISNYAAVFLFCFFFKNKTPPPASLFSLFCFFTALLCFHSAFWDGRGGDDTRADLIVVMFDAHKLDISDELKMVIDTLKPHHDKMRSVCLCRPGSGWDGMGWDGMAWHGMAWHGMVGANVSLVFAAL